MLLPKATQPVVIPISKRYDLPHPSVPRLDPVGLTERHNDPSHPATLIYRAYRHTSPAPLTGKNSHMWMASMVV